MSESGEVPERLYGVPGAEHMDFDLASAYEGQIDPFLHDNHDRPQHLEEWSVRDTTDHLPTVDWLIDQVCDRVADCGELDEDGYFAFENAAKRQDVIDALQAALDLWASKVTYRMADRLLRTYEVTWDDSGEPLIDGEPLYVAVSAPRGAGEPDEEPAKEGEEG